MKAAAVYGFGTRLAIEASRLNLQESPDLAAQGTVEVAVSSDKPENISDVFARPHEGRIKGRLMLGQAA